jgi:hypothetical protein
MRQEEVLKEIEFDERWWKKEYEWKNKNEMRMKEYERIRKE